MKNETNFTPITPKSFECTKCHFICSKKSDWSRHILTRKHTSETKVKQNETSNLLHICPICSNTLNSRTTLWRHTRGCKKRQSIIGKINKQPPNVTENVARLLQQQMNANNEFKQMMIDQTNQLLEIAKTTQTINNHTTNNNNQKFNLNFFLNDTCKDAISITDFLRNMNVHIDEIEYIGNHGYVNGMTKMIMDRMKDMDITKRPIHCTDIKRETMYIKDEDGWSKDTDELSKLRKILSRISMNNYRIVPDWRNAHPDCEVMESHTHDFCYKMMRAILGDAEEEQIRLDNKIIKTLAKELFVQK
jgi:hypothetical protein